MTKILIIAADFYPEITEMLVAGATATLKSQNIAFEIVKVPGAFEIPATIRFALPSATGGKYDGFIALGCVIRGETTHYDYVCSESARGLMDLTLRDHAAIGYGILTVETMEQAIVRANVKQGNKGADAANACLRLIELKRQFDMTS